MAFWTCRQTAPPAAHVHDFGLPGNRRGVESVDAPAVIPSPPAPVQGERAAPGAAVESGWLSPASRPKNGDCDRKVSSSPVRVLVKAALRPTRTARCAGACNHSSGKLRLKTMTLPGAAQLSVAWAMAGGGQKGSRCRCCSCDDVERGLVGLAEPGSEEQRGHEHEGQACCFKAEEGAAIFEQAA